MIRTVELGHAKASLTGSGRCQAVGIGRQCASSARWCFLVPTPPPVNVNVCRMHANKGERDGKLQVVT